MSRLLYENSVSYKGYLIIPFVFGKADNYEIYSYKLLAEIGDKSQFHKAENPAGIYGSSISNIIETAKEHINKHADFINCGDSFKSRYLYRYNLIIISQQEGKYFYDHYPPELLNNIAAPKLFKSEFECINWIKQGLEGQYKGVDRQYIRPRVN
ncbi:hypothetical protein NIES22_53270 [Calothrix brevissima NIES-22]|nr:hypothetical protein NIES22_53270 [Calothrix brevissima NIES-22]